jgi:hypothetical protein
MDIYDLHSRFFGIWCNDELIGGVRAVIDKREFYNPLVYKIGHQYDIYNEAQNNKEKLVTANYADFPFLSYACTPSEIKQFYEEQKKDKKVIMSSRCIISEEHRGLKTIQLLTESIIMIGMLLCGEKAGLAVTDGSIRHTKFFSRYGFSRIRNVPVYSIYGIEAEAISMLLTTNLEKSSIPQYFHKMFQEMVDEFKNSNQITRDF